MTYPLNISLTTKFYKSFGELDGHGFKEIKHVNVVIGRNNSGKSSLIDLIQYAVNPSDISQFGHKGQQPQVFMSKLLEEREIREAIPSNSSHYFIQNTSDLDFFLQQKPIGITVSLNPDGTKDFISLDEPLSNPAALDTYGSSLGTYTGNPLSGKVFKRLMADRNILPERDSDQSLMPDGRGATNIIQMFLNRHDKSSELVEVQLLEALNRIFEPDAHFSRIQVKQLPDKEWEVHLHEEGKGLVSLSNSGSGLKTVILVLVSTILIPSIEAKSLSQYVFAFEELENNLHPGVQRRLLRYLRELCTENDCCTFITTHSNVIIDLFGTDSAAQIIHVQHDGLSATAQLASTSVNIRGVLDDLDVRASDLLQSNCIVWVEGPSDRVYFKRWLSLFCNDTLAEGVHFQCVNYGGKLLAHLSAIEDSPGINLLKVNRNSVLLIDSDRKNPRQKLNQSKNRLIDEISTSGGVTWVTHGNEVENYIPTTTLRAVYNRPDLPVIDTYESLDEYLERNISKAESRFFLKNKVVFAEKISPFLTKEELALLKGFETKLGEVIHTITMCNT
ncbi:MAG: AAA family ATPase [Armatimonadota bacterium]